MTAIADHVESGEAAFIVDATCLSLIDAIGEHASSLLFAPVWAEHDEQRSAPKDPTLQVDLA